MRLIDAQSLRADIMRLPHNGYMIFSEEVEQAIADAQTIDAVPVIHCRECKHYDGKWLCKISGVPSRKPDDFCSYGERKEGAT